MPLSVTKLALGFWTTTITAVGDSVLYAGDSIWLPDGAIYDVTTVERVNGVTTCVVAGTPDLAVGDGIVKVTKGHVERSCFPWCCGW